MKKFVSNFLFVAVVAALFSACEKPEEKGKTSEINSFTFVSSKPMFDDASRTEWNGSTIVWSAGDAIRMAYTVDGVWQNATGDATEESTARFFDSTPLAVGGETAEFTIPASYTGTTEGTHVFYTISPKSIASNGQNLRYAPNVIVGIPQNQTVIADSFDPTADLMIGKSTQEYTSRPSDAIPLRWSRLVAHGYFTLKNFQGTVAGEIVRTVTLTAQTGAHLTGSYTVNLINGSYSANDNAANHITVKGNGLAFETVDGSVNLPLWISVMPETLTELTVRVETDKATYTRVITGISKSLVQNKRNTLGINMSSAERTPAPTGSWILVTDDSALSDGDKIVITNVAANKAISTTQNANNRQAADITPSNDKTTVEIGNDTQVIVLEKEGSNYYLNVGDNAYLYAASSSSNHLKTTSKANAGDNGKWSISISQNVANIIAQGSNSRNIIRYNTSDALFSCYASGQQAIAIYKEGDGRSNPGMSWSTSSATASIINGVISFDDQPALNLGHLSLSDVSFTSSDESVATVDDDGDVTIISGGTTTISAEFDGDATYLAQTVTYELTVSVFNSSTIADIDEVGEYTLLNVNVMAVSGRNLIVADNTGLILVYAPNNHGFVINDVLNIDGSVKEYNGVMEFYSDSTHPLTIEKTGTTTVVYPTPVEYNATRIATYAASPIIEYGHAVGVANSTGRSVMLADGSVINVYGDLSSVDGRTVSIYGYAFGYNNSMVNFMLVGTPSIDETVPYLAVSPTELSWDADEYGNGNAKQIVVTLNGAASAGNFNISGSNSDWNVTNNGNTITIYPYTENTSTINTKSVTLTIAHSDDPTQYCEVVCSQASPDVPSAGTVLWTDTFGSYGSSSSNFNQNNTLLSGYSYQGRTGYRDNSNVTLVASNNNVKSSTASSVTNCAGGHLWFNKNTDASVTTSAIQLYGAINLVLSYDQDTSGSLLEASYSIDGGESWTSFSASGPAANVTHTFTVTPGTSSVLLRFTHSNNNNKNTRFDNPKLTVGN